MSAGIVANVLKYSRQKSTKRLIMVILAGEANSLGVAQTKIDDLAVFANVDPRRISDHIAGLETSGELFVFRRDGLHNVYVLLPGLQSEQRAAAVAFINTQYRPDQPVKIEDLPPMETAGVTPDESSRGDGISRGHEPLTNPAGEPLTESAGPPDESVSGYKDSVVVVQNHDLNIEIQQQGDPPALMREPAEIEKTIFAEMMISPSIWRGWMIREPVEVLAAFLHVRDSQGIENPLGLMRSMIEQQRGAPKRKFVEMATRAIEHGNLDETTTDPALLAIEREAIQAGYTSIESYLTAQTVASLEGGR